MGYLHDIEVNITHPTSTELESRTRHLRLLTKRQLLVSGNTVNENFKVGRSILTARSWRGNRIHSWWLARSMCYDVKWPQATSPARAWALNQCGHPCQCKYSRSLFRRKPQGPMFPYSNIPAKLAPVTSMTRWSGTRNRSFQRMNNAPRSRCGNVIRDPSISCSICRKAGKRPQCFKSSESVAPHFPVMNPC
jgi:hypothetical protein